MSRPPHTLYLTSKIRTTMPYHAGTLMTRYWQMRPLTKWSHVVRKNSRSTLSITSNKVRQIIGRTLVCLLILLECWLNKARVKLLLVVQWVWHTNSIRLQFGFKICRRECNWCWFNSHSKCNVWMRIQFAFKQNQVWRGINIVVIESHDNSVFNM